MPNFEDALMVMRNYCVRYGEITNDAKCEINGNHDRITTFLIGGEKITISMHNGKVSGIIYR